MLVAFGIPDMDDAFEHDATPPGRRARHTASSAAEHQAALLNQIYNVHRIAALNGAYFSWKVDQITRWNGIYEGTLAITTALTAGTGLSNLFFLPTDYVKVVIATLASISALLAAVKPTLGLARRLETYTRQCLGYQRVFAQLDKLVREIAEQESVDARLVTVWKATRERYYELKATDPTYVNRQVLDQRSKDILQRYPDEYYWKP